MNTPAEKRITTPDKQHIIVDAIRYTTEAIDHCADWKRRASERDLYWPLYCDHTNLKRVQSDRFAMHSSDLQLPQMLKDDATRLLAEWNRIRDELGMTEPRTEKDQEDFNRRANQHATVYAQFYTQLETFERAVLEFFEQHAD